MRPTEAPPVSATSGIRRRLLILLCIGALIAIGCASSNRGKSRVSDSRAADTSEVVAKPDPAPMKKPPVPVAPTVEQLEEAERSYQSGLDAVAQNRLADAVNHFESIYKTLPQYKNVSQQLQQAYLFLGMEHYTEGEPEEAIRVWNKVLRIDPKHEKALAYIRKTKQELQRIKELPGEKEP